MDFVRMKHPEIPNSLSGEVTRQSFDTVHVHKGWVIATDEEVAKADQAALLSEITGDPTSDATATEAAPTDGTTTEAAPTDGTTTEAETTSARKRRES